jgi:rhomboid protease GluP
MGYSESSSVLDYGAILGYNLFVKNEWWRLVTSMLMHANILHLLINLMVLFFILAFWGAMFPLYQGWRGALVFFGAGIVSSFCCALYSDGVTVGASGAIMGMIGYPFGCLMFNSKKRNRTNNSTLLLLAIFIGPTILLSFTRGISLAGHVSGLLCGVIAGIIADRLHSKE